MYQQVTIVGNLGSDPEMRYTASGVPVTSFSVAVSRSWTGQDGQRQEKTVWFRVSAWRKLAETCAQYLSKGSKVLVVGELSESNVYTAKDGTSRASLDLTADTVQFLSPRSEAQGGALVDTPAAVATAAPVTEDDIPF